MEFRWFTFPKPQPSQRAAKWMASELRKPARVDLLTQTPVERVLTVPGTTPASNDE
jgi:hypothetical protein